jgi:hypothetical protein
MPLEVGDFIVAKNVYFNGNRVFAKPLVVVAIGKRVKAKAVYLQNEGDKPKHVLLHPAEVLAYYKDLKEATEAAAAAHRVWTAYDDEARVRAASAWEQVKLAARGVK